MSNHTPGPWTVGRPPPDSSKASYGIYAEGRSYTIARVPVVNGQGLNRRAEPAASHNANLIAAAPDLHDALNRLWLASHHSDDCQYAPDSMSCSCGYESASEQALAALRKAEGKS